MDAELLADINKLDAVVRQLGIGASFEEPAEAVAKLQGEIEDLHKMLGDLRRVLGWVLLTAGDDDFEVMVSESTMQQHQSVTLTRRDNPSGGFVVGAEPTR